MYKIKFIYCVNYKFCSIFCSFFMPEFELMMNENDHWYITQKHDIQHWSEKVITQAVFMQTNCKRIYSRADWWPGARGRMHAVACINSGNNSLRELINLLFWGFSLKSHDRRSAVGTLAINFSNTAFHRLIIWYQSARKQFSSSAAFFTKAAQIAWCW